MARSPKVLLIGGESDRAEGLGEELRSWGCECTKTVSRTEAERLLEEREFDVVLCKLWLPDGSGSTLLRRMTGRNTSAFYSYAVEEGCVWLPALDRGRECWGRGMLWADEFAASLKEILREASSDSSAEVPSTAFPRRVPHRATPSERDKERATG